MLYINKCRNRIKSRDLFPTEFYLGLFPISTTGLYTIKCPI